VEKLMALAKELLFSILLCILKVY